jgi:transcriptional regulator with XRE-family HTH domain
MRMISPVARFGDNLRTIREALGLNQKELAAHIHTKRGGLMNQAHISKMETMEWAPRPETARRVAEGLARASGRTPAEEFDRLLDGVSSRFDAAKSQMTADPIDRLRELIDQLPADKRADLVDVLEQHTLAALRESGRKGA